MEYDFLIGTIRFNNKTYIENINWKKRKDYIGCAYGLNKKIPVSIKKPIFVIEMNNTVNKIMGIGKINNIICNKSRMYHEDRYNKYLYKGKKFISRLDIIKNIDKGEVVLKLLENELFLGYSHFKRGHGLMIYNWDRISRIGKKVKKNKSIVNKKKCVICGKVKKGHICKSLKKNILLEKYIHNWFNNLFKL